MKEGTHDTPHGIGIRIWRSGAIREGYWKDGQLDGRGRVISYDGECYIGELEGGSYNGEGTYYKDGDKYTGIWVNNWEGQGEVNYKDGKKYTGQWEHTTYDKHGLGTLYSADGQVLSQGKWSWNEYKGKE